MARILSQYGIYLIASRTVLTISLILTVIKFQSQNFTRSYTMIEFATTPLQCRSICEHLRCKIIVSWSLVPIIHSAQLKKVIMFFTKRFAGHQGCCNPGGDILAAVGGWRTWSVPLLQVSKATELNSRGGTAPQTFDSTTFSNSTESSSESSKNFPNSHPLKRKSR